MANEGQWRQPKCKCGHACGSHPRDYDYRDYMRGPCRFCLCEEFVPAELNARLQPEPTNPHQCKSWLLYEEHFTLVRDYCVLALDHDDWHTDAAHITWGDDTQGANALISEEDLERIGYIGDANMDRDKIEWMY